MAHCVSLQMNREDFLVKDVYGVMSTLYPSSFPVTCSQTQDPQYDPTKGNRPDRRTNEDKIQVPPPSTRRRAPSCENIAPATPPVPEAMKAPSPPQERPSATPCEPLQ